MLDFQREPAEQRCDRCHEVLSWTEVKLTSENEPYCNHCGYVFGMSIAPSVWACDCGETVLDHGGDRPHCVDCEVPMICQHATASRVHSTIGDNPDLDQGLAMLLDAQEATTYM